MRLRLLRRRWESAIEFITNKGAKIQISAKMFGKVEPINPVETRLMRLVYKLKYSKQAGK